MKNLLNHRTILAFIWLACTFNVIYAQTTVSGLASYRGDSLSPLAGISIMLYDMNNVLLETTQTDIAGHYEFVNLPHGEYVLTGSSNLPPGEINIIDALMVADHIEGVRLLEGIALLAADVDGDGEITWADYNYILIEHLVYGYPFPVGDWVFERITFAIDPSVASPLILGVGGSSSGDVKEREKDYEKTSLTNDIYNMSIVSSLNQISILEIKAKESIELAGFLLAFPIQAELFEIVEVASAMPDFGYGLFDDRIIISAAAKAEKPVLFQTGDALVQIKIKPKKQILNSDTVYFKLTGNSHFVDGGLALFEPPISLPALSFNISDKAGKVLLTSYPNPAKSQVTISYTLADDGHVALSIFSLDGKLLRTLVDGEQKAGTYKYTFSRAGLPQGLYLLRLTTNGKFSDSVGRHLLFSPE